MRLNGLYVPVSDYRDILTSMDSGQCDVGIFTGHAYISYVLPDANYWRVDRVRTLFQPVLGAAQHSTPLHSTPWLSAVV
jgi:hypothetical protein